MCGMQFSEVSRGLFNMQYIYIGLGGFSNLFVNVYRVFQASLIDFRKCIGNSMASIEIEIAVVSGFSTVF